MLFELVGEIRQIETIASGNDIRELARLIKWHGEGHWRKLKGIVQVRLSDGSLQVVEVHWYEAHGVGRKEFKIKAFVEE